MALPQPLHKEIETVAKPDLTPAQLMEQVMIKGDLSNLTEAQRAHYFTAVCKSLGLNPLTKPFEYIKLNGKLTLYARRDATDQLRSLHKVSIESTEENELGGVYIVVCKVKDETGRTDIARGAVSIKGLSGEHLANAIMKAETKAKRRATLSICGLGFIDETELETIEATKRKSSNAAKKDGKTEKDFNQIVSDIRKSEDLTALQEIQDAWAQEIASLPVRWADLVKEEVSLRVEQLGGEGMDEDASWSDEQ